MKEVERKVIYELEEDDLLKLFGVDIIYIRFGDIFIGEKMIDFISEEEDSTEDTINIDTVVRKIKEYVLENAEDEIKEIYVDLSVYTSEFFNSLRKKKVKVECIL